MTIDVRGEGLHVDRVTVSTTARKGQRFQLYAHTGSAATQFNVTRWKRARTHQSGRTRFSAASWTLDRRFRGGTWLCAAATRSGGNPCVKIHK